MESEQSNSDTSLWTRRDCTLLGAKVFAITVFAVTMFSAVPAVLMLASFSRVTVADVMLQALATVFVVAPPAALAGGAVGFELYRLAAGSRQPRETSCVTWSIGCLITGFCSLWPLVMLFFLQSSARKHYILQTREGAWAYPAFYSIVMILMCVVAVNNGGRVKEQMQFALGFNSFVALFMADSLMVIYIADCWTRANWPRPKRTNSSSRWAQ